MEIKRDLLADLAICEGTDAYWRNHTGELMSATEAREGWAHAIRRAIAAEAEVTRLRESLENVKYYLGREAILPAEMVVDDALLAVIAE